jgi:serine/threonine-protein kinase
MFTKSRADELLERWQHARTAGEQLTVEDLCRDWPELLDEIRAKIATWEQDEKATVVANDSVSMPVRPHGPPTPAIPGTTAIELISPLTPAQMALIELPGYEILKVLGRGGMGVVYKARQPKLDRIVAVKVIRAGGHASENDLARFVTEAQAVAALQHPNIVQIYETGDHNGQRFFTMEFVAGGSLADKVDKYSLPPKEAAALVEPLARAMAYAHGKGVVHRDLKPENVLLETPVNGGAAVPKITDFGVAKRFDPAEPGARVTGLTMTGDVIGTPSFMAPEQARGDPKAIGPATDIYALGAILYASLTGRPPFQAALPWDVIEQVIRDEPVTPSSLVRKTPRDLETIILKCLRKEPRERYPSAEALADDLRRFLNGEPIVARPIGRIERCVKWAKRYPTAAALLASLVLGIAVSTGLAYWAIGERGHAKKSEGTAQQKAALAQQKQTEAEQARDEAKKRYMMALMAFSNMVSTLQSKLEVHPGTQHVRKELLTKARDGLRYLLDESELLAFRDSQLVWSCLRLGDVEMELGNTVAGQKQYQAGHDLARRLAEADPSNEQAQYDLVASYGKIANAALQLGQTQAALESFQEFNRGAEKLVAAKPLGALALRDLTVSYIQLGDVALQSGNKSEALSYYRKGLPMAQRMAKAFPENNEVMRELSVLYNKLGHATMLAGQTDESIDFSRKGLEVDERRAEDNAYDFHARLAISTSYERLGDLALHQLHDVSEARIMYLKCLQMRQRLVETEPKNVEYQRGVAIAYDRMGNIAVQLGQGQDALDNYKKSLLVRQRLVDGDPKNAEGQQELFVSYYKMGVAHQAIFEYKAAVDWLQKAKTSLGDFQTRGWITSPQQMLGAFSVAQWQHEIDDKLAFNDRAGKAQADLDSIFKQKPEQIAALLETRLRALLQRKQLPEAIVTAERWAAWAENLKDNRDQQRCNAACAFAMCAALSDHPEPLADQALTLLGKAKTAGFLTPELIAEMKKDKDLDGIRKNPKFVQFMAELEPKK